MSKYAVYVTPSALREIKDLPGHVRQQIKRIVDALADDPRSSDSKALNVPEALEYEVWRLRLDKWRVLYAITEEKKVVDVLAVRKRPPYDYSDFEKLLANIE